jgi:hypothetical protein
VDFLHWRLYLVQVKLNGETFELAWPGLTAKVFVESENRSTRGPAPDVKFEIVFNLNY